MWYASFKAVFNSSGEKFEVVEDTTTDYANRYSVVHTATNGTQTVVFDYLSRTEALATLRSIAVNVEALYIAINRSSEVAA